MGAATLASLLADQNADIDVIYECRYLNPSNVESVEYVSQRGWMEPLESTVILGGGFIPPLLETDLQVSQRVDPLNPTESFGTYSQLSLINDSTCYPYTGRYDAWQRNSVDGRAQKLYLVGHLSDGTLVSLSDVITTPLFSLIGIEVPEVSDSRCVINTRDDSHSLDRPLQPITYSPPCIVCPGTVAGCVDFGDNYDQTGSFSACGWVYLDDPTALGQYIFFKDGTTTGYYFSIGGAAQIFVGNQTPTATTSASGLLHARQWHFVSYAINTATGVREIGLDGVSIASSAGVTGSPNVNSVSFTWGRGLKGKLARWTIYSAYRTIAAMYADARIPLVGNETNLAAWFPPDERVGPTVHDRKLLSSITGTLGTGVTWGTAAYHYAAISGQFRPWVLGTVPRVPATILDPVPTAAQVMEFSYGGFAIITEVQSNHTPVSSANYTVNKSAGIITATTNLNGTTVSGTVTANNFWNSALQAGSTSTGLATINSVNGSVTIGIQYTPSKPHTGTSFVLMGWQTSASAGTLILRLKSTGGANHLEAFTISNAGVIFTLDGNYNLVEGRTYSLALKRDVSGTGTLTLHVDGEEVASTGLSSGVFTTTRTQFGIMCRPDSTSGTQAQGRYDEPWVIARAITQDEIRALHVLPATGSEPNLTYLWHLDEATGTSAASALGGTAITLANITWVGGRTTAEDLARKCYYIAGYSAADLDTATWRECLNDAPYDCGWFVGNGESALDISRILLGGLNFVPYKVGTVVYIRRFAGITGTPEETYTALFDVRNEIPIESESHDPVIWQWVVRFATNNTQLPAANIAQALAASNPDAYNYGQMPYREIPVEDYSIVQNSDGSPGRFPQALSRPRLTALLNQRDAEEFGAFLLALHRHSSDTKSIPLWMLAGSAPILHEAAFTGIDELEMTLSDWLVIGLEIEDDLCTAVIWRPARQTY